MNIREIRELTGLSQRKFSEKYHIPTRTIEQWECQTRIPPVYVVEMLERIVKEDILETKNTESI